MIGRLWDYGRKAIFLVRVLSGYEERRIRAYRLILQERIEKARAKNTQLGKIPEKIILSEVRSMVKEMQSLNQKLIETEAAIEEYFGPIDKNAHIIMNMQLDKEEKRMKDMIRAMQEETTHQKAKAGVDKQALKSTFVDQSRA